MPYLMILRRVRENNRGNDIYETHFLVQDHVVNPEKTLRNAIQEFLKSDDAIPMIEYSGGDYNWGDAVTSGKKAEAIWAKHGISLLDENDILSGRIVIITVNQDETLYIAPEEE